MQVSMKTGDPSTTAADLLALPLFQPPESGAKLALPSNLRALDRSLGHIITAALESGDFGAKSGQTALLYPSGAGQGQSRKGAARKHKIQRVLLLGLGTSKSATLETVRRAAGRAATRAGSGGTKRISLLLPSLRGVSLSDRAQAAAEGAVLGAYQFDRYRAAPADGPGGVRALTLFCQKLDHSAQVRRAATTGVVVAESQNIARDLSNQPGNELPPTALAAAARRIAKSVGLACHVMDVAELKRRKMGGILAVGGGSSRPPCLIVLQHGARARTQRPTVCLVGKGVTFDSGGISIKPSAGMDEMKHDMGGAASVIGALRAAALLDLPLHVVGIIGSAENLPSGTAYRPGDIVRTASGKTIEVLNTDAEGRIVLADALHYAKSRWKPDAIVDLATLTGAMMIALGPWASGLFGNDEELIERVRQAGDACGECAWPMPLFPEHKRAMHSTIADLKNTGGRHGGGSTAAGFLSAFVGKTPWVHLDIAGTGWTSASGPYQRPGATGVGVRLLTQLLRSWKTV